MNETSGAAKQPAIELLCRLATFGTVGESESRVSRAGLLDERTRALVSIAAVIASVGGCGAYRRSVDRALEAGATIEEIVEVLIEIAPTIGLCRLATATSELATAVGYDLDAAFESFDPPRSIG